MPDSILDSDFYESSYEAISSRKVDDIELKVLPEIVVSEPSSCSFNSKADAKFNQLNEKHGHRTQSFDMENQLTIKNEPSLQDSFLPISPIHHHNKSPVNEKPSPKKQVEGN